MPQARPKQRQMAPAARGHSKRERNFMSTVPGSNSPISPNIPSSSSDTATNGLGSLTPTDFLNMLIVELQNQDPLDPTDSTEILQQTGIMSQITSTTTLTDTLNALQTSDSISSASSLIGKTIAGTDANSNAVDGVVSSISISDGSVTATVGDSTVPLDNITSVQD
jgi:flagellar basal-body rod modification protein FlgD